MICRHFRSLWPIMLMMAGFIGTANMAFAAPTCQKTGTVCTDANTTKTISGQSITRACWNYQDTYQCVSPNNVDYCAPLVQAGCTQTTSTCVSRAWNNDCLRYTNTYRCGAGQSPPSNTVTLNNTYTLVSDVVNTSQCKANLDNPNCTVAESTCTEAGGTRIINGLSVTKDCWAWNKRYACAQPAVLNSCTSITARPECSLVKKSCVDGTGATKDDPSCGYFEFEYSCKNEQKSSGVNCDTQQFCTDGNCFNANTQGQDTGILQAVSALNTLKKFTDSGVRSNTPIFVGAEKSCRTGFDLIGPTIACCNTQSTGLGGLGDALLCKQEEKELDQARLAGTNYYAGSYCGSLLAPYPKISGRSVTLARNKCLIRNEAHCVFGSKLARIIVSAAREQLGQTKFTNREGLYYDTHQTNCDGITAEQITQMDFSKIDFTEIADDIKAKLIDPNKINELIEKIKNMAQNPSGK